MLPDAPRRCALTMVVPTYNERPRLDALLRQIFDACGHHRLDTRVIVVDDDSSDGTGALADAWAGHSAVQVIHRPRKLGLGSAVRDGFALAESDIVGVMDADHSHPPAMVPALHAAMVARGLDMIVGSRYVDGGATRGFPIGRLLLSTAGCWLSRPVTPVRDAMSGFFLLRRRLLHGLGATAPGFKIGLDLLVRAHPAQVAELGYEFVGRVDGESKMSMGEGARFLRQVLSLYREALTTQGLRPRHLILPPAAAQPRA